MSNGIIAPTKEEKKELKPSDFPPVLRKIVKFIGNNPQPVNLTKVCNELGLGYNKVMLTVYRYQERGLDFYALLDDMNYEAMKRARPMVDTVVTERALEGAHKHMELFYKRVRAPGFTDPKTEINVNIQSNFNTIVCPSGPPDLEPIDVVDTEDEESKG